MAQRARITYQKQNRPGDLPKAEPDKPKGSGTGKLIMVLLVIGAILYFISG